MAELLVQRKKRSALPWIVIALIIIGIIGYLVWRNQHVAPDTAPATTSGAVTDTTHTGPTGDNGANRNP